MGKIPWYSWYPADYLASPWVEAASLEQEAIFRRLLDYEWKHPECQLPDNPAYLRRLCKNAKWPKILSVLESNFERVETEKGGFFWKNPRIFSEFLKCCTLSQQQSAKAKRRWNKENPDATAVQMDMPNACLSQSQSQSQSHKRRETKKSRATPAGASAFVLPDWIRPEVWKAFEEMRLTLKKPMTDRARGNIVERLAQFKARGHNPTEILDTSITNSWQYVYEPKPEDKSYGNGKDHRSFFERDVEQREQAKRGARALLGVLGGRTGMADDIHAHKTDGEGAGAISGEAEHIPEVEAHETG